MADWRLEAVCIEVDPELFFPIGNTGDALLQIEEAKSVCRRCEVRETCLRWALDTGQDAGVWGGLSEDERRALKRRNARAGQSPAPGLTAVGTPRRADAGTVREPRPGYVAAGPVAVVIELAQAAGVAPGEIAGRLELTADAMRAVRTEKLKSVRESVGARAEAWAVELRAALVQS